MESNRRFGQQHDQMVCYTLRLLQFASCVVALVLVAVSFESRKMSFQTKNGGTQEMTVYFGGPAVNFVIIVSFTASLYDAFILLFVLTWRCAKVPALWTFGMDAVLTMLFMSAGCALAASDYVRYCNVVDGVARCSLLASSAALCFMAFVSFLLSVAWGAWMRNMWIEPRKKIPLESVRAGHAVLGDLELDDERAITLYESSASLQNGFRQSAPSVQDGGYQG
ncbi:Marvel domain [Plasmopara halstedii]|uniref:Marvel domain n=1 Tax=Plasmopara halstedii TaxID=4781 RepID=A0A0P1AS39_PLAHL|nr:Marvel domain [Plasmopara halstedii]CEG44504.1 Marvel domain [Plasmopara halstedii]|eukprot:XP_024580873.1 Marvel domain [Plasmopara halstedii]